ncbi:sarcolemmal membrane-associated protein-like isoform X2 [Pecten maximus]|uniref:sarcolemmal membrane-associated protein-like isoform X1 n=1 Tax=Pecten maximus TaxID=6579 RepID=UPI0014589E09|nr:sarcolemmal membrane-associated protein-like isoform X1 [Pecten maximus]XP_033745355.1 sarcolemmal membrane-associated protein-like isoform X2 [Pecten maximus]
MASSTVKFSPEIMPCCGMKMARSTSKIPKSSNGTFINNQRLCKGGEESPAREVYSGDQIQFGVDVMENNRRGEKITHGCIIATITLFHPDGREAKNIYSESSPFVNTIAPGISIQSQDLYQLAHYLQEALHREKMLEQKLTTLQKLLENTQEASETGWQALITEDRLLSRLDVLENQLHTYSKNHAEDSLRQEVVTLQEEKLTYETTAKESLRKVLQEKLEAVRKLSDLERSMVNTEEECGHLKDMCERSQEELQQLAEKYQDQLKEVKELQDKLSEAERNLVDETEKAEKEKICLQDKLDEMVKEEDLLSAKLESLQADNDITMNQLAAMKAKLEALKEEPSDSNKEVDEKTDDDDEEKTEDDNKLVDSNTIDEQNQIIPTSPSLKVIRTDDIEGKLKETQQQIEKYKAQLEESDAKLKVSSDLVAKLQKDLEVAKSESNQYESKMSALEDKLRLSDLHMNQMMENTMADLELQLKESHRQSDSSNELIKGLQDKVNDMEGEIIDYKVQQAGRGDVTLVGNGSADETLHNHLDGNLDDNQNLNDLLLEAKELQKKAEVELRKHKSELDETKMRADTLQDQLSKAETTTQEVKEQILDLRDRLLEEQAHTRTNQQENERLKSQLDQEKTKHKDTKKDLDDAKRVQQEAQQNAKQSHNETEQLKIKVRHLQERVDDRRERARDSHHSRFSHSHSEPHSPTTSKQRGNIAAAEFTALKEECSSLRKRIQAIEAEMKMSRKENLQLSAEYNKLQESYKHLEALKVQLERKELAWKSNLTDSQKESEQALQEVRQVSTPGAGDPPQGESSADTRLTHLEHSREEVAILMKKCETSVTKIGELKSEIDSMAEEYHVLANKSKMQSFASSIPLLMLLFGILMALYPWLAQLTATTT